MIHVRSSPGTHVRTFNEGLTSNHSNKNQLSMTHRLASMAMNWELKYIKIRAVCRPKKDMVTKDCYNMGRRMLPITMINLKLSCKMSHKRQEQLWSKVIGEFRDN